METGYVNREVQTLTNKDDADVYESLPVFDDHSGRPDVWRGLLVGGSVKRPQTFTAEELALLSGDSITDDFRCVEGWSVPDQTWGGVRLDVILNAVEPLDNARYAAISAADYTVVVPLDRDIAGDVLLATRLNGAILPEEHGGPCRLVSRDQACYASIKWVDRIVICQHAPPETARDIAMERNRAARGSNP